jgi:DNA-binding NtrC family response regulator
MPQWRVPGDHVNAQSGTRQKSVACVKVLRVRDTSYAKEKDGAIRELLRRALIRNRGNRTHTARDLGIDRAYLQRLIRKYELR